LALDGDYGPGTGGARQTIEDAANAAWAAPGVTEIVDQVKMVMTF
jgi:hypothetical protein